jgi:predicted mannosyl-3-phosphoglycerate phosphatase (HAD superfamily)
MDSLVIFSACNSLVSAADGTLSCAAARHAMELLRAFSVPVVFIADQPASEMLPVIEELGVKHPFVAKGGAELHVPRGYFPDVLETGHGDQSPWQVLRLQPSRDDAEDAVRLLMALYRFGDESVLFVGVGEDWKHRSLLRAVDVPVILRNEVIDQGRLVRTIPDAYVTTAAGVAGWEEAILGGIE